MRHTIVALTRCSSAIDSLGVLDCLQLFHTPQEWGKLDNPHLHKPRYTHNRT